MLKGDNKFDSRNLSNISTHTQKLAHNYSSILVVKDRKQFKCLPTGEQINIIWYIHTMKYYAATKKEHNTKIYATTWKNFKPVLN